MVPEVSIIFDETQPSKSNETTTQTQSYKEWKQHQIKMDSQQSKPQIISSTLTQPIASERKKNVTFHSPVSANGSRHSNNEQTQMKLCENVPTAVGFQSENCFDGTNVKPNQINRFNGSQNKINLLNGYFVGKNNENDDTMKLYENSGSKLTQNFASKSSQNLTHPSLPSNDRAFTQNKNNFNHTDDKQKEDITLEDIYRLLSNMQLKSQMPNELHQSKPNNLNQNAILAHENANLPFQSHGGNQSYNYEYATQTTTPHPSYTVDEFNSEPSIRELFNIIMKQQEQLLNIQKQVHILLMHSLNADNRMESKKLMSNNEQYYQTGNTHSNRSNSHQNQIGVMTSLEINVQRCKSRSPNIPNAIDNDLQQQNKPTTSQCCNCNNGNKNSSKNIITSDSESSSSDDNLNSTSSNEKNKTGWTFYGNILNQVNDVLENTSPRTNHNQQQRMQMNTENHLNAPKPINTEDNIDNTAQNIYSARFKEVGFQIDDVNISAKSER